MGVTVLALIKAKKGKEERTRSALLSLIGPTRQEAGCINYDLHELLENPGSFMFYENWKSREDLERHLAMPYLQEFLGQVDELLAEPVDLRLFEKIG